MNKNKFDVYEFLYEGMFLREQGDEEVDPQTGAPIGAVPGQPGQGAPVPPDPNAPQPAQAGAQEPTPAQANQQVKPSIETPFDQFTGASIKNIEFKPHENGGTIVIYTSLSPLPLTISWAGDRVTAKYKGVTSLT